MCCCRADHEHDETMKFQIRFRKDISEEEKQKILNTKIFENKEAGGVRNLYTETEERVNIGKIEKYKIAGRSMEIYKCVKFMVDKKQD